MLKQSFGVNAEGREVSLWTIENDRIRASFSDYGATMVSLVEKETGIDILLGYDSVDGYRKGDAHIGGFIGRTGNRTKGASFTLNGRQFHLDANSGDNSIHGGTEGFDVQMYETEAGEDYVQFHRVSPDGEMGYPGTLDVTVRYSLLPDGVEMKVTGKALDQDTLFNITNHNYYNLNGGGSVLEHVVTLNSDLYGPDDETGVAFLPLLPVAGTPFDFRTPKKLGTDIADDDPQLIMNLGYDHYYEIKGEGLRTIAVCEGDQLVLAIDSNLPGMHMYTANFLHDLGKGGTAYEPHCAVCFEPEYLPNAINYEGVLQPILKAGETSEPIITMRVHRK